MTVAARRGRALIRNGRHAARLAFAAAALRHHALHSAFVACRSDIEQRERVVESRPLHARLENLERVQLALHHVPVARGDPKPGGTRFLTLDAFRQVEHLVPGLLTLTAFGLGEPFLNPALCENPRTCPAAQ